MALTQEQRKCVETLDRPLVVAAGAGSGKTFTLTQRIAGAFETGYVTDIDEVCAITFTKKAATELKSRIKAELRARGFVDQALRVDEAWVSTIHGMCSRILRAHAIELGIDPAFSVVEGTEVVTYRDRALDNVLKIVQTEHTPGLDALFAEYRVRSYGNRGVSVESMLSSIVEAASIQGDGANAIVMPGAVREPGIIVNQVLSLIENVFACVEAEKANATRDRWLAETAPVLQEAHGALANGVHGHEEALRIIAPFNLSKQFGSKDYKALIDEARIELSTCVMEARLGAAHAHLETLVMLARRVLDEFATLKRADGVLDNNDLLVMAAQALEHHPDIAACYADKFKLVMVDEFQDTDQMQVDMIKRLAGEGASRLCTVGDAQQSIYGFRGADVSVYRRHLKSIRSEWSDSVINLSENFRSHPDVLAFVDCVFEKPNVFGGEFMSLSAGREEGKVKVPLADSATRVIVQHTSNARGGASTKETIEVAAQRIADEFARFAREGHSAGEMALLLGRMTYADVYARALRGCGLPCVVTGGSVFARSLETQVMAELVRAIANPLETQSVFNVLTGPLFACTVGDLQSVGGIGGFWRAAFGDKAVASSSPQLACALSVMTDMRESIGCMPVARIMERVVTDSGWLSRLQAQGPEGFASAGNVFKAIRIVRDIEAAGTVGPASVSRRFVEKLEGSKEAPGALSVSGGDSVRIMTIHSSKGLEFPIVAVAEMKEDKASSERLLVSSVAGKVYLSLDLDKTLKEVGDTVGSATLSLMREAEFGPNASEDDLSAAITRDTGALRRTLALGAFEAEGDAEEAKRLLYVAITRAREAVIVSSVGTRTKKGNLLGFPKNAMANVFAALDSTGTGLGEGRTLCDFGGTRPAVVELVALTADVDEPDDTADEGMEAPANDTDLFAVPVVEPHVDAAWEPFKLLRQDVFSYSSISEASHEGDVLDRLADSFAVSADAPKGTGVIGTSNVPITPVPFGASMASFDDDFWDFDVSQAFDEDRATDLGTAFHRLAQFAVVQRSGQEPLEMPPAERIKALSRTCNLDGEQRARLSRALQRWFGSEVAHRMAGFEDVSPEVPFFVAVPAASGDGNVYLEGEIDLLAFDAAHAHATVVDYKTGGHDDETADDLRRKHVLQAACYAYAVMLQGAEEVEAVFVRVERSCADDANEPQCVRYQFQKADIPALAKAIAEVYARNA
ncbi:MAG: UvrD-helicase domain-containing protein [Eggerthellaceae bacterium]|nr:UvrD-helicase domain-containing protein [Eggerthellaceae bacterium]